MSAPPISIIADVRPNVTLFSMTLDYVDANQHCHDDPNSDASKAQVIWNGIYDKMIHAFQVIVDGTEGNDGYIRYEKEYNDNAIQIGLELFAKYFTDLWN